MTEISYNILEKNTCIHQEKKCNHLLPFSELTFKANKKFTNDEKEENLNKYKRSCSNQNGIYTSCCDKNDKTLDKIAKKIKKGNLKGIVEYDRYGNLKSVELCKDDKCKKGRKLTGYELCKIGDEYYYNDDLDDKTIIKDFNKDCYSIQCNPQEKIPNILGTISENYTFEMDKNLSAAIEKNDIKMVRYYIQKDPTLKKRVLTHNQEGNTIFHESLKYNSGNNLYYIFKQASKEIAFKQNLKGDTILHMAMCIDSPNAITFALKLGCDINEKNNLDETPIYCAIKKNLINNVRMAINNIASLDVINKDGDTPLLSALRSKVKNVDLIRLLVERGSDINSTDSEGNNALKIINSIKNPIREDEEVRTYLEQITLQNMGINIGDKKDLSKEESDNLNGIIYNLKNAEKLGDKDHKFKINIDYSGETENYYPDDLEEKYMQPYKPGDKNLSHEPYFDKFKNLQKDKLEVLKKTILLTKWDNKNDKNKKLKIIDEIMEGKRDFNSYKYEIMTDNGIKIEQEHMIFNDYSPNSGDDEESITLKVKGKNEKPYDIQIDFDLDFNAPIETEPPTITDEIIEVENEIVNSFTPSFTPAVSVEEKTLLDLTLETISKYSNTFLITAILLTLGIIFSLYVKSKTKNGFNIKNLK